MVGKILSKLLVEKIVENLLERFLLDEKMLVLLLIYPAFLVAQL